MWHWLTMLQYFIPAVPNLKNIQSVQQCKKQEKENKHRLKTYFSITKQEQVNYFIWSIADLLLKPNFVEAPVL